MTRHRLFMTCLVAAFALAPFVLPARYVTSLTYIGLYVLVGIGLVILTGVARMTSFGQAAFCGTGAYTTALHSVRKPPVQSVANRRAEKDVGCVCPSARSSAAATTPAEQIRARPRGPV